MDYQPHIVDDYQYRSPFSPWQQHEERWDVVQPFKGHSINRMPINGSPTQSTMDRYLQQDDRTWFTTVRVNTTLPPCPDLEPEPNTCYGSHGYNGHAYRYPSPTDSGPSSAYHGGAQNDHQCSPWSSPHSETCPQSPKSVYHDHSPFGYGLRHGHEGLKGGLAGPCVTLHEVQGYPDAQPEPARFPDEANYYAVPQEGFEPMEHESEPAPEQTPPAEVNGIVNGNGSMQRDRSSPDSPNIRRRRPTATRALTSPTKVSKRNSSSRRSSSFSKTNGHKDGSYAQAVSNRAFPCPFAIYNCPSTFGAKNEWKRHVNTQHMQTGYWRCNQCDKNNDFNRKDLFIQHVRRMHQLQDEKATKTKSVTPRPGKHDSDEQELNKIAKRCFNAIRTPPEECACIVCDAKFIGESAWDERLEHIGKHWEAKKKENEEPASPKDWRKDDALQHFLGRHGIIEVDGKRWVLVRRWQ